MHIALTGASGFIGSVLARHLTEAGHTVTALVRETSRRDHIEPFVERFVVGPHHDGRLWAELLEGADSLIHNSFDWQVLKDDDLVGHLESNLLASIKLIHAAAPRQVVFMSSMAVHHDMRPRWAGVIDEDHPTRPGSLYGAHKAAVEAHLWAARVSHELPMCALRPCAVYGMDPRLDRTIGYPIVQRLRSEGRYEKAGGGKFVHVDDVAAATVATIGNPDADGQVYNLVDCYARWADLAMMIRDELRIPATIDTSAPTRPANEFDCAAARSLGVAMDRGHDGLREHLRELTAEIERHEHHAG